jgi:hypothetical protein
MQTLRLRANANAATSLESSMSKRLRDRQAPFVLAPFVLTPSDHMERVAQQVRRIAGSSL